MKSGTQIQASAPKARRAAPAAGAAAVHLRMRITAGELIAVGPGKVTLLEAIAGTGSIAAAAKSLRMSYRRAWLLLDEMNRALRRPVVETVTGGRGGGRTCLTAEGTRLVALYRQIEKTALVASKHEIRQLMGMLAA